MKGFFIFMLFTAVILGPSVVIAVVGYASISALARNPAAAPKILQAMIYALFTAQVIAIIALLILFNYFAS
jgi:F0F1-type ATP synthase membrane subunit c/vacuolar-type H+-ATPase subunit K